MQAVIETVRGGLASAEWVMRAPFVNLRAALWAETTEDARDMIANHFSRFLRHCGIDVVVDGESPAQGFGSVFCYNEASFADVSAFAKIMLDRVDRAAAADLYAYLPFGRTMARKAKIELVPRGNRAGTDRILDKLVEKVRGGERLAWGGEGRIHGKDGVAHFKRGASLIAIRAGVPIVPVTFFGGHSLLPLGSVRARAGTVFVRFGAPISTIGLTESDARDLADKVQAVVTQTYEALRRETAALTLISRV